MCQTQRGNMIQSNTITQETNTSDWTMWGRNGNEPFYREDGDVL